jgi:hexulose-6-phosphate isomerase
MKTALNKWCLPVEMSVKQAIALCAQLGYDGLELNLTDEGELTLETTQEALAEMAAWAQAANLALPSVSTGLHWRYPITSADADIRTRGLTIVRKQLEAASIFGADTVLLVPGLVTAADRYDLVWQRAVDALQELAEDAARLQVRIGIENVGNYFLLSPLEMRDFIDMIDSPWVGAYYDVGNTVHARQGWPQHWIQILGNRICKVHVKDHRVSGASLTPVPLLTGDTIDWPSVMAALRAVGYDDYITVEISPYKYYPLKLAQDAAQSLATLISTP